MLTTLPTTDVRRAAIYTLGLAGLWVLVAAWRPQVTYHLAPLLIAAVPPIAITINDPAGRSRWTVVAAGSVGLIVGAGATAALSALGWLSGPSLLPTGGAAAEAIVFSFVGAVGGTVVGVIRTYR
jgi:hypothetical protein